MLFVVLRLRAGTSASITSSPLSTLPHRQTMVERTSRAFFVDLRSNVIHFTISSKSFMLCFLLVSVLCLLRVESPIL